MKHMRRVAFLLMTCAAMRFGIGIAPAQAQEASPNWSSPISIVQTNGQLANTPMALLSDRMGRVHLLFPHKPEEAIPTGIDYMAWEDGQWSEPVNVLINPDNSPAQIVRAVIDQQDMIHAIWGGGNNKLYYSSAPAAEAGSARSWLTPTEIAQSLPTEAGIAVAPNGSVWVAYADATLPDAIGLVTLPADGETWLSGGPSIDAGVDIFPGEVGLAIDDLGRMHLTWTTIRKPDDWPPTGVYYARSLDQGATWETRPILEGDYGQAGVAIPTSDEVHIFWSSTVGGDGTYHQWSEDGGETWSNPNRFIDRGGFSGLPSFSVDSSGNLHYLRGSGVYAMWANGDLTPVRPITTDEVCLQGQVSCGERAQLALTFGNRLHAVFETDFNQLWYTSKELDTPAVSVATPTPAVPAAAVAQEAEMPAVIAVAWADDSETGTTSSPRADFAGQSSRSSSQVQVLLVSILPALLLVAGVTAFFLAKKSSR